MSSSPDHLISIFSSQPGQDQTAETVDVSPTGMAFWARIPLNKGTIIAIRPATEVMNTAESDCYRSNLTLAEVKWTCVIDAEQGFSRVIGVKFARMEE